MSSPLVLTLFSFIFLVSAPPLSSTYRLHPPPPTVAAAAMGDAAAKEAQALLTFKAAITHDPSSCLVSWTSSSNSDTDSASAAPAPRAPPAHCIGWNGVLCDNTGSFHVTSLNLSDCGLSGTIAPHSLGLLPSLSVLDLSYNNFSGELPPSLFNSTSGSPLTYLDVGANGFLSGAIPDSLALNSPNLRALGLCGTGLSGPIPSALWTHLPALQVLDIISPASAMLSIPPGSFPRTGTNLSFCDTIQFFHLEGLDASGESFPSALAACQQLQTLWLSVTGLEGSIPASVWQLPNLQTLLIEDHNVIDFVKSDPYGRRPYKLHGSLPPTFGFCSSGSISSIQAIAIDGVNLTGHIPPAIAACGASLKQLDLSHNSLEGHIPSSLGNLTQLKQLYLEGNNLTGDIPATLSRCSQLVALRLGFNPLSGSIPRDLGLLTDLQHLSLFTANLQGTVPVELCNCTQMLFFDVGWMYGDQLFDFLPPDYPQSWGLTGTIPDCFSRMASLQTLAWPANHLEGGFPQKALQNLTQLQHLDLSYCSLDSDLPTGFNWSAFPDLEYLSLKGNSLRGAIPAQIGQLTNLTTLALDENKLHGPIPPELGALSKLTYLGLSQNHFQGNLPNVLNNLTNVVTFRLSQNNLTGEIEGFDLSKMPNLQAFSAYGNAFHGGLPDGLTEHQELIIFDVQRNTYLTGSLGNTATANIIGLSKLRVLLLSYNQLSGDIPPWVWRLPNLQALDLSNNRFTGRLPETLTHLSYFKRNQSLSSNQSRLNEVVPVIIKHTLFFLTYVSNARIYFDVSMNNLEGEIPESFGELRGLTVVNLSHNQIQGTIPVGSFGKLPQLEELDLSYNQLNGGIPEDLTSLNSMSTLNLSYNHLQGSIPTQNYFDTRFDSSSFSHNPGLCGSPLIACNESNNSTSDLQGDISNKVVPRQFEMRVWLNEFVSPRAFLCSYLISLVIGIFIYQ